MTAPRAMEKDLPGRLLAALSTPRGVADLARRCGAAPLVVARRLLRLCRDGRVRPYCQDLLIARDALSGLRDGPVAPDWSPSRRVAAALAGGASIDLADVAARSGLPMDTAATELQALVRLGSAESHRKRVLRWHCAGTRPLTPSRLGALELMVVRGALLAAPGQELRIHDVAWALDLPTSRVNDLAQTLLRGGELARTGHGRYVATETSRTGLVSLPAPSGGNPRRRPRRVGDAILACLETPRQACDIAGEVGRSVSNVTGHLRALRVAGLVVRIGWGRYARADMPGLPPPGERCLRRPRTLPKPHQEAMP